VQRLEDLNPADVLKWMLVVFVGCMMVLCVIAVILSMFGVFG
jgi:hypothetical protein